MDRVAANAVAVACAASAGVHVALTPHHLEEDPLLGIGFAVAAVCLFAGALAFTRDEVPWIAAPAVAVLLAALMTAYAISRSVGLPLPGAEVEPLDVVGIATQAIQSAGLLALVALSHHTRRKESLT
jgi:drug/metabolite transporter (DMT)-like permease